MKSNSLFLYIMVLVFVFPINFASGSETLLEKKSALIFYGIWDDSDISRMQGFDIITLQQGHYRGDNEKEAVQSLRSKGSLVFFYISIGEDSSTYNGQQPRTGDGRGPSFYDPETGEIHYQNKGIAGFYLDQWNHNGFVSGNKLNQYSDGLPDRHGDWGACIVNGGDPAWQDIILEEANRLTDYGIDGFFLDTPETADPWQGYGWTAEGFYRLIERLDNAFPNHYLLLNRGIFFFDPNLPFQYAWNPSSFVDITLFESYYLDNNYSDSNADIFDYHMSPYYYLNKYDISPKVHAIISQFDHQIPMIQVDYARNPDSFPVKHQQIYDTLINESVGVFGRIPYLTDRYLSSISNVISEYPASSDEVPPVWLDSSRGKKNLFENPLHYNVVGSDYQTRKDYEESPYQPRIGIQKLIPSDRSVTIMWDAAVDQTRPVRYNIYYSDSLPFDFDTAHVLNNVPYLLSPDFTERGHTNADNACPYEYTITGLAPDRTYYAAVRAEDSTINEYIHPQSGKTISKGLEDTNTGLLAAFITSKSNKTDSQIDIDGNSNDWKHLPAIITTSQSGAVDQSIQSIAVTDDEEYLYIALSVHENYNLNDVELLLNTDKLSYTGDPSFFGSDYAVRDGRLQTFGTSWDAVPEKSTGFQYRIQDNFMEIAIPKEDIKIRYSEHFFINILDKKNNVLLPAAGSSGFCIPLNYSDQDTSPPVFLSENYLVNVDSLSEAVVLEWSEAYDDSGPVLYDIVDANTGAVIINRNGKPLEDLNSPRAVITGIPLDEVSTLKIIAKDKSGNQNQLENIKAEPKIILSEPIWLPFRASPEIRIDEAKPILYFSAALQNKLPSRYNLYIQQENSNSKPVSIYDFDFKPADDSEFDYMFTIPGLKPFETYQIMLEAVGAQGIISKTRHTLRVEIPGHKEITLKSINGFFEDWDLDDRSLNLYKSTSLISAKKGNGPIIENLHYMFGEDHLFLKITAKTEKDISENLLLYFDIDNDINTGFKHEKIGVDFALRSSGQLYRLENGADWVSFPAGQVTLSVGTNEPDSIELALPEELIGKFGEPSILIIYSYADPPEARIYDRYGPFELYPSNQPPNPKVLSDTVIIAFILLFISLVIAASAVFFVKNTPGNQKKILMTTCQSI